MRRSIGQKVKDFLTFPFRAVSMFEEDRFGLSSLRTERFDYVAAQVDGFCLDVGCGRRNIFVKEFLRGNGKGIDVFPYEGLKKENLVEDITHFPFDAASFDTVTFIANLNHIPGSKRALELAEAYRCLKPGGKIIVTMGNPLAEVLVHKVVLLYDLLFKTHHDMDNERGMDEEESLYLTDSEITICLCLAGFGQIMKKHFWTQWGLNAMFIGWKLPG
jgi:ubiquinone/menaquinone biosynthesis C-methylase UbiE